MLNYRQSYVVYCTIGEDLIRINGSNLPVCIMGDFIARTALLSDFEVFDTTITSSINIDEFTGSNVLNENLLQNQGITTERYSKEKKSNNHGSKLTGLCKCFDIHICNGRLGKDKYTGSVTSKNASLAGYVIISPVIMSMMTSSRLASFTRFYQTCTARLGLRVNYHACLIH